MKQPESWWARHLVSLLRVLASSALGGAVGALINLFLVSWSPLPWIGAMVGFGWAIARLDLSRGAARRPRVLLGERLGTAFEYGWMGGFLGFLIGFGVLHLLDFLALYPGDPDAGRPWPAIIGAGFGVAAGVAVGFRDAEYEPLE